MPKAFRTAQEIGRRLERERVGVRVLGGAELGHEMVARLSQRELECIAQGPPGRRWVLLEAALGGIDNRFSEAADELRQRGYGIGGARPPRALGVLITSWLSDRARTRAGAWMETFGIHSTLPAVDALIRMPSFVREASAARLGESTRQQFA